MSEVIVICPSSQSSNNTATHELVLELEYDRTVREIYDFLLEQNYLDPNRPVTIIVGKNPAAKFEPHPDTCLKNLPAPAPFNITITYAPGKYDYSKIRLQSSSPNQFHNNEARQKSQIKSQSKILVSSGKSKIHTSSFSQKDNLPQASYTLLMTMEQPVKAHQIKANSPQTENETVRSRIPETNRRPNRFEVTVDQDEKNEPCKCRLF